jgi:phosphoenolpyruvate synthase/pyruvate phosphate dikinase
MGIENLKKNSDWIKMWSGKCCINSCTQMGEEWTRTIRISGQPIYRSPIIFIIKNGITDCWATQRDKDDLGKRLIMQVKKNSRKIKTLADSLVSCAEKVLTYIEKNSSKNLDFKGYNKFWEILNEYYLPHISVKYTSDYLSADELKKYLAVLQKARVSAEPVFKAQENFMEIIAGQISKKTKLKKEFILSTTKEEIRRYFEIKKMPKISELIKRHKQTALIYKLGKYQLYSGVEVKIIEQQLIVKKDNKMISGFVAHKGNKKIVRGRVRIVLHPANYKGDFEKEDILVTGMTRPEFMPFLKKAAAIITDSGGVLSHAAIISREMKKLCIVGTKVATKFLKDGDLVEINPKNGTIKVIK